MTTNDQAHQANLAAGKKPLFFREDYAGFIVKGNFMTLAAKPHLVEEAEWLAHQSESIATHELKSKQKSTLALID